MDKLRERRNWTGRRDTRLVKNLLIKRKHDNSQKRVQILIQLCQTTTRKRSMRSGKIDRTCGLKGALLL